MDLALYLKFIILVLIFEPFFIFNESVSAYVSNNIFTTLVLSVVMTDITSEIYKFYFSHPPGFFFYINTFVIILLSNFYVTFFEGFFCLFFGIDIFFMINQYMDRFLSYEHQFKVKSLTKTYKNDISSYNIKKGIFLDEINANISHPLGIITSVDKRNIFELLKTKNGVISFDDSVSINFQLNKTHIKFFDQSSETEAKGVKNVQKLALNFLIEQDDE